MHKHLAEQKVQQQVQNICVALFRKRFMFSLFVPNASFLQPLKTSENHKFSDVFRVQRKGAIGNKWVNEQVEFLEGIKFNFCLYKENKIREKQFFNTLYYAIHCALCWVALYNVVNFVVQFYVWVREKKTSCFEEMYICEFIHSLVFLHSHLRSIKFWLI